MFAITKHWVALGLGLVACAGSSTRGGFPEPAEEDSKPIPTFGERTESEPSPKPQATATKPDEEVTEEEPAAAPECPSEKEPNNDTGDATVFTSCVRGELSGWTDTDNLSIVVPQGAAEMQIDHIDPDGAINYTVTSGGGGGGSSNMSFTDQAPKTKVKPGTKYTFALKWDNNGQGAVDEKRTYAIRVAFLH